MSQPTAWDGQEATAATALRQAVKPDHQPRFSAIVGCIDAVCAKCLAPLADEYAALGQLLAALCCQEGSPVVEGRAKPESWAAGILWTIGSVNFLNDRSFEPTMTGKELAAACGVSEATMQARCRDIRDGLDIQQLDPRWTLPSRIGDNPMTWMFETNGIILDFRDAPRDVQAEAYEAGLIPYIPADGAAQPAEANPLATVLRRYASSPLTADEAPQPTPAYQIKITLRDVQPTVWRRLRVPDCALDELHDVLQLAMGWEDCHMHEFAAGKRRFLANGVEDFDLDIPGEPEDEVWLSDLVAAGTKKLTYMYDFGDGWGHDIKIEKTLPASEDLSVVCLAGAGACPPEDCGGPWGYMEFVEAINNPQHERHDELREWWPDDWDPNCFEIDKLNESLEGFWQG